MLFSEHRVLKAEARNTPSTNMTILFLISTSVILMGSNSVCIFFSAPSYCLSALTHGSKAYQIMRLTQLLYWINAARI